MLDIYTKDSREGISRFENERALAMAHRESHQTCTATASVFAKQGWVWLGVVERLRRMQEHWG
jgi:hypothetical protein